MQLITRIFPLYKVIVNWNVNLDYFFYQHLVYRRYGCYNRLTVKAFENFQWGVSQQQPTAKYLSITAVERLSTILLIVHTRAFKIACAED
jgi:hypothetical protein